MRRRNESPMSWNKLIKFRSPTLDDLISFGAKPLRPDIPGIYFTGDNTVAIVRGSNVINVSLVFNPDVYSTIVLTKGVKFVSLSEGRILDIDISCSAQAFVNNLRKTTSGRMDLATLSDLSGRVSSWELTFGRAVTLAFVPNQGSTDPDSSHLELVTFHYGVPYCGTLDASFVRS